jgi:hypothetical protein
LQRGVERKKESQHPRRAAALPNRISIPVTNSALLMQNSNLEVYNNPDHPRKDAEFSS